MRRSLVGSAHGTTAVLLYATLAFVLAGCGSLSRSVRAESALLAAEPASEPESGTTEQGPAFASVPGEPEPASAEPAPAGEGGEASTNFAEPPAVETAAAGGGDALVVAQAPGTTSKIEEPLDVEEYDPWEGFNEKTFEFNRKLDRYVLKPVAKAYNRVLPDQVQLMIENGFDNIRWVPRFINSVLQAKWDGAGREVARFVLNSTLGIGGLFDPAKVLGFQKSQEDFGQTLGVWGAKPGPYLIVPFLEPMTVRDGIGLAVDGFMDPLGYFVLSIVDRFSMKGGDTVNDRSLNLDLFQGFEESVVDMYSAVRHGYLNRREKLIRE